MRLNRGWIVGANTKKQIERVLQSQKNNILTLGSRGDAVKKLQNDLKTLGFDPKSTDGKFGKNTQAAVKAFQKAMINSGYKLSANGKVGKKTLDAIKKELSKVKDKPVNGLSKTQRKMIENLKNDTTLGLSANKKKAMVYAAERLLAEGYEVEFVAGMLGNIQNEGEAGKFESSNYKSHPEKEPSYLVYMDKNFHYKEKYSGRSISDIGIEEAIALQKKAEASGYKGKFGFGMGQWTGKRTSNILAAYQKYHTSNKPSTEECIKIEVDFMVDELKKPEYSYIYNNWKKAKNRTAQSAAETICYEYERPKDKETQAKQRGKNATKIYNIMMKS